MISQMGSEYLSALMPRPFGSEERLQHFEFYNVHIIIFKCYLPDYGIEIRRALEKFPERLNYLKTRDCR